MHTERTEKCLRQVEHIHGHLWHLYSLTVNKVMMATVKLSKLKTNLMWYTNTIFWHHTHSNTLLYSIMYNIDKYCTNSYGIENTYLSLSLSLSRSWLDTKVN